MDVVKLVLYVNVVRLVVYMGVAKPVLYVDVFRSVQYVTELYLCGVKDTSMGKVSGCCQHFLNVGSISDH